MLASDAFLERFAGLNLDFEAANESEITEVLQALVEMSANFTMDAHI
jgi:hypothetical protein